MIETQSVSKLNRASVWVQTNVIELSWSVLLFRNLAYAYQTTFLSGIGLNEYSLLAINLAIKLWILGFTAVFYSEFANNLIADAMGLIRKRSPGVAL